MALHAQHNTQIHTQSKITKTAKKYTEIHKFLGPFWTFLAFLERFTAEKIFASVFDKLSFTGTL